MKIVKSFYPKKSDIQNNTMHIDATGQVLGRLASRIASILRGKHKPIMTPGQNVGDKVLLSNVDKIVVTGKKMKDKMYYKHTGYVGNLKSYTLEERMSKDPTWVMKRAVKGMLPRGPLANKQLKMLRFSKDTTHAG